MLKKFSLLFTQIQLDIENFKDQGIELESQRKVILKNLEDRQSKATADADEYEQKYKEVSKILDQLKAGDYYEQCFTLNASLRKAITFLDLKVQV